MKTIAFLAGVVVGFFVAVSAYPDKQAVVERIEERQAMRAMAR